MAVYSITSRGYTTPVFERRLFRSVFVRVRLLFESGYSIQKRRLIDKMRYLYSQWHTQRQKDKDNMRGDFAAYVSVPNTICESECQ